MAVEIKLAGTTGAGMDRKIRHHRWSLSRWPVAAKLTLACLGVVLITLAAIRLVAGAGVKTIRLPAEQVTLARVQQGIFHDLIPLHANVVPRETVYVDAIDGGRVDRVLVEAGDLVQQGQPIIELSNTNLALSVIQQESQLNQAISQLQQNEIVLEQNKLSNERALAEVEYGLVRLSRSDTRRAGLLARGAESAEQRDVIADELVLPALNGFLERDITFEYLSDPMLGCAIVAVWLVTGLAAGAYAASVLSLFRPGAVLKGAVFLPGGSGRLRQALVIFQSGRLFAQDRGEDDALRANPTAELNPSVVINETGARALGYSSPQAAVSQYRLWSRIVVDGEEANFARSRGSQIIGVVPDFSVSSVRDVIEPTAYYVDPTHSDIAVLRLDGNAIPETMRAIKALWARAGGTSCVSWDGNSPGRCCGLTWLRGPWLIFPCGGGSKASRIMLT